jgi:hypothetical protein
LIRRKPGFRPSLAETKRRNQEALDFLRALSTREDAPRLDLQAKAKRVVQPRPKTLERDVLKAVLFYLRRHRKVAWVGRINSGAARNENGQFLRFHTIPGCSDIIGQMRSGHFLAIEVKRPGEKPTPEQMIFLDMVLQHSGCAGWCDSVEACERLIAGWATQVAD